MEKLKNSIVKHLRRHARQGGWIRQRALRNSLHSTNAALFNQAAVELARVGVVELDGIGSRRTRVIRLKCE
jgi:hypothetical protein